jgi:alkanesulfonate monooxygenase SsuD/methylene tetrahydromethanopterin reductase-like flavin-dependent oxidoreductase (luciferase family)
MKFGGVMFLTDYSMSAMELAQTLEERGFESVWTPEHSHIPLSRKTCTRSAANYRKNITMRWIHSSRWLLPAR